LRSLIRSLCGLLSLARPLIGSLCGLLSLARPLIGSSRGCDALLSPSVNGVNSLRILSVRVSDFSDFWINGRHLFSNVPFCSASRQSNQRDERQGTRS
jgi:hypothetical protein